MSVDLSLFLALHIGKTLLHYPPTSSTIPPKPPKNVPNHSQHSTSGQKQPSPPPPPQTQKTFEIAQHQLPVIRNQGSELTKHKQPDNNTKRFSRQHTCSGSGKVANFTKPYAHHTQFRKTLVEPQSLNSITPKRVFKLKHSETPTFPNSKVWILFPPITKPPMTVRI